MNPAHVGVLSANTLSGRDWYRAVDHRFATVPPRPSRGITRYNPGPAVSPSFGLLYFAPDPVTALFEVQTLLGSVFSVSVPNPFRTSAVLRHTLPKLQVVDLAHEVNRLILDSSLQEITGEWRTYRSPHSHPAPTQGFAAALYMAQANIQGFLAPSARNPDVSNLVLFPDRL